MVNRWSNADIESLLVEKGVKPTPNRVLVMRELLKSSRPMSLGDLEEALDFTVDKASVYRVLELFAEKEVVHSIEDGSRSIKYEVCRSGNHHHSVSDQHVHFYCEKCHDTFCFESLKIPEVAIPEGYLAHSINFVIKGVCPKCAGSDSNS